MTNIISTEKYAMDSSLLTRIASLPDMTAPELKKFWRELHAEGEPPPFNRVYYVKKLAYRLQELTYGMDSKRVEKRLDESWSRRNQDARGKPLRRAVPSEQPIAGTRLIREYGGEEHVVTALTQGFEYRGKRYRSLSVIARTITGTHWSGPLFFGLRRANGGGA